MFKFPIAAILTFSILILSCSQNTDTTNTSLESSAEAIATAEETPSDLYTIEGEEISIRTGPGNEYNKIVNEKATSVTRKTQYCQVDYTVKVAILERRAKWAKIKVIEPDWLSDSHIGWIPAKYIIGKDSENKQELAKLDPAEYEVLKTRHNSAVENFHVLLKRKPSGEKDLHQFVEQFREQVCTRNCNVDVYDSKSIASLIGIYPLERKQYLKMADHLMSISTFDAPEVRDWYPYQDFQYRDYGGKNWKKKAIN